LNFSEQSTFEAPIEIREIIPIENKNHNDVDDKTENSFSN